MIVKTRFSLDTSILIYAVDRDAGQKHESSRVLLERAALCDCILTLQVLAEFFHATTRKQLLDTDHAFSLLSNWMEVFEISSATDSVLIDAVNAVRENQLSFWDAMLWATVRQSKCSALISEDMRHGQRLHGVEIINPFIKDAEARLKDYLIV